MTPAPLQLGQAPSELALNSAGFTPLAFANALRIGSSSLVYVAGLLRREPRIGVWSIDTTPSRPDTEPWINELFPDPATPVTTPSRRAGCRRRRPAGCGCWRRAPPALPTASATTASGRSGRPGAARSAVSYTHLRAHETKANL